MKVCSECFSEVNIDDDYCGNCGHKLRDLKSCDNDVNYCQICKERVSVDGNYCGEFGHKIDRYTGVRVCPICGKRNGVERYCWNCGHDLIFNKDSHTINSKVKICPNCGSKFSKNIYYCEDCGMKL